MQNEYGYDPALNMTLPKEECDPEKWLVVIENKQYRTGKVLYNDIEVGKHYQFRYHPLTGLKIVGGYR